MYAIYNADYVAMEADFETIEDAARWALAYLPSDDFVYLIGTDAGIEAVVFQGQVFYPRKGATDGNQ